MHHARGLGNLLFCTDKPVCYGMQPGDPCTGRYQIEGACAESNIEELLVCVLFAPCDGKDLNDACIDITTGADGICKAAGGEVLLCQPASPCQGKAPGDSCGENQNGTCVGGEGDESLWCFQMTAGGMLDGINTDACGNVYVTDATSDSVWRFSSDGLTADFVTNTMGTPVTGIAWGSGIGGWGTDTLYLSISGGAEIVALPIGIPGRPLAGNGTIIHPDTDPTKPAAEVFNCLNVPDEPLSITELDKPRGYHDVAFDDEGYVIGSNGVDLVRVSYDNSVQLFASGFEKSIG